MHLNHGARRGLLSVGTALVVAHVRHGLETGWSSWQSWEQFLGYWFLHWLGLVFFSALVIFAIGKGRPWFLEGKPGALDEDDLQVQISLTLLLASAVIFLLAHLPTGFGDLGVE
jgi:hypothetical protein